MSSKAQHITLISSLISREEWGIGHSERLGRLPVFLSAIPLDVYGPLREAEERRLFRTIHHV